MTRDKTENGSGRCEGTRKKHYALSHLFLKNLLIGQEGVYRKNDKKDSWINAIGDNGFIADRDLLGNGPTEEQ